MVFTYQNAVILASLLPIVIFGFLTYYNSKEDTTKATSAQIQSINQEAKKDIQDYFKNVEFTMHELTKTISFLEEQAKNNIINIQTLQKKNIKDYYATVEKDIVSLSKKDIFQYIYSFLKKSKKVDNVYLDNIKIYKNELGFKNIMMVSNKGKILYASDDEKLVGTYVKEFSLTHQSFFSQLTKDKKSKAVHIVNFGLENISKKYKQYAITRFKDVDGFVALEINQDNLQKSIENVASLGKSAETYLVFENNGETYLASNRHIKEGKVGDVKSGKHINVGFFESGTDIKYGSLGDMELVGYMPIKIKDVTLSMQTTVAYEDIISPIINGNDYFQQFVKDYDYHNIMIVGPKGNIFYSVTKEKEYKTNIFLGKYAKTHLLKAVKDVLKTKKFVLSDLDVYPACNNGLAQFALSPILRKDGTIQSIVVIQLNKDYLTKILDNKESVYKTHETYVVGKNYRLRSDTALMRGDYNVKDSFIKDIKIKTQASKNAFKRGKGILIGEDYRGVEVLSSYDILEYKNLQWAVITEVNFTEIDEMLSGLKNNIFLFVLIASFVAFLVMIVITNEKKKQDKKLQYTATHDSLTGLPNRKFALEFLSFMLANQKRLKTKGAVLFIDLDKFKIINDSYGHETGDLVLVEIASRLKNILRKEDLVARLGGDEFIVIMNNFRLLSDIDHLCNKLISEVSHEIFDAQRRYEVGVSIGIATFPEDSNVAEELLQFSDTAMFRTKDNGRNGYTYYNKKMTEASLQISRVEEELKQAIENDELVLYYQPQVNLLTQKVVGVEALVRWEHPRDGLIMPNDFIAIAEESDLIIDLGYWVAREACTAFQRFQKSGMELEYIAVNMSTKQLQSSSCIESITSILEDLDFDPRYLELEITENTLISNLEDTLKHIDIFKEMGIKFSIDDFGTGYSSLSYLKSLPISTLKIDREFIKDILVDKDDKAIVNAIIAMGHTLNYTIIAEGAESKEEVDVLRGFDCDTVQGYYYSKPLKELDLLSYVKNGGSIKNA